MSCKVLQPWASPLLLLLTGFPQPLPRDHLMPFAGAADAVLCSTPSVGRKLSRVLAAFTESCTTRGRPPSGLPTTTAFTCRTRTPEGCANALKWFGPRRDATLDYKHLFQLRRVRAIQDGAAGAPSGLCSRVYPPTGWRAAAAGCRDWIQTSILKFLSLHTRSRPTPTTSWQ